MTMVIRDLGSVARTISGISVRDGAGTLRTVSEVRARDANNVSRIVFSTAADFIASASPNPVSGYSFGVGTATTVSTTATPTGGTGPYTYAWTLIAHDGPVDPTAGTPTAATTTFTQTSIPSNFFYSATFRCTVTDSLMATATTECVAYFADIS